VSPAAAFASLADIEALERTPYDQAIPARTTYGLIARAAAQFPNATPSSSCPTASWRRRRSA
jgi:hypothetical protein